MVKEDRLFILREHEHASKNEATLEAFHLYRLQSMSGGYDIKLKASKPIFHAPWIRGGKSQDVLIGTCRTLVAANIRINELNKFIKELTENVESKRQAASGHVQASRNPVRGNRVRMPGRVRGRGKGKGGPKEMY